MRFAPKIFLLLAFAFQSAHAEMVPVVNHDFETGGVNDGLRDAAPGDITSGCTAADGISQTLQDDTLLVEKVIEVCDDITVGPNYSVGPSGFLTLRAGSVVIFRNGTSVTEGGSLAVEIVPSLSAGNTIRVPEDFPTIGAAVDAAGSGDTVLVSAGTYNEVGTIYITKDLILASTFIDSGNQNEVSNTVIRGGGNNDLFIVSGGANVRIEGLTIENTRKPITIDVGDGTIRHNVIRDNGSDSISFEGDSSGVVELNTIVNSGDDGIDIDGLRGPYTVRANSISGSSDDGMEFRMLDNYLVSGPLRYEVYENIINGTGGDGIQLIDYPTDNENRREINIHHNYIKNATFAGIGTMPDQMTQRGGLTEPYPNVAFMERVFITNNTIVDNDNGIVGGDNFIVLNNIIANNRVGVEDLDVISRIDYTMFLNNNLLGVPSDVQGSNIMFDDPELNSDGSLQGGSPAIDAGVSTYTWRGESVLTITTFNGSAPDLGWIEVGNASSQP